MELTTKQMKGISFFYEFMSIRLIVIFYMKRKENGMGYFYAFRINICFFENQIFYKLLTFDNGYASRV